MDVRKDRSYTIADVYALPEGRRAYLNAGVREYWIVDPLKQMVRIYDFENEKTADYKFSDPVTVGIYSGLQIRVADYLE